MNPDDRPGRTRRYSDEEVRTLLDRAAELERQGAIAPSPTDGPTLAELEQIAEEAGMNPAAVRRAAKELGSDHAGTELVPRGITISLLGAPLRRSITRIIEGEIPPEALQAMRVPIEHAASGAEEGRGSVLRRSLTWRSEESNDKPELRVSVTVDRGETRIRIEERHTKVAAAHFGGITGGIGCGVGFGVGMGVGLGALESVLFAVLFPITMIGGTYAVARGIFRSRVDDRARTLEELADELTRIAERETTDLDGEE